MSDNEIAEEEGARDRPIVGPIHTSPLRNEDEFDVTCQTCGEEILSWPGAEARKWITRHKKKHRGGGY